MNGTDITAVIEYARRSHENAERAANAAMRVEAAHERMQRELSELRRDMRHGFEALNAALLRDAEIRPAHVSLTEEDWEDSPTGTHKMVSRKTFDAWQRARETSADARKWRKVLNTSGKIALALVLVVLGWVIRHFLGKP